MTQGEGVLRDPSPAIEAAFFAVPRHRFVQRFRTWNDPTWRTVEYAEVYTDEPIILAAGDGAAVASTCSMPSYILALVQWLDVRPGHRVLEIGSGCGWLAAVLGHLAGPAGHVVGVEFLADLAEASRRNLADIANVEIITGDGAAGYEPGAPYDRVIATAGMREIPGALMRQTKPGALLLLPIRTDPPTSACIVRLFERIKDGLECVGERPGFFVPMQEAAA